MVRAHPTVPFRFGPLAQPHIVPETPRMSAGNRRAVAHAIAKLSSAGFDIEPWLAQDQIHTDLPAIENGLELYRSDAELLELAKLEHRRWVADRIWSGWRLGPPGQRERKLHPDLVPFDELPREVQEYDAFLLAIVVRDDSRDRAQYRRGY